MVLELALLGISVIGLIEGIRLTGTPLIVPEPLGPGWYLIIVSSLLMIASGVQILRAYSGPGSLLAGLSLRFRPSFAATVLLVMYITAIHLAGYLVASALFFIAIQLTFGERSLPRAALVGLGITGVFYLVFDQLAGMPLP